MAKQQQPRNLNLFAPIEEETTAQVRARSISSPEPEKIKDPCPRCGSRSLRTVRAHEHGGNTNYCAAGCLSDDRTDAFYFTPEALPSGAEFVREIETEVVGEGEQQALIETGERWEEHWRGMPEFVQEDLAPWKSIYVHFESREDMEKFAKLVKQKIGLNTRSIWYPEAEIGRMTTKRYVGKGTVDARTKNDPHRTGS